MTNAELNKYHEDFWTHFRGLGKAMRAIETSRNMKMTDDATHYVRFNIEHTHEALRVLKKAFDGKAWANESDLNDEGETVQHPRRALSEDSGYVEANHESA